MKKLIYSTIIIVSICWSINAFDMQTKIIKPAQSLIGSPYRLGATGPGSFDCSGFVNYLYKPYVKNLPRVSRDLAKFGEKVDRSTVLPGDLVFFATGNNQQRVTHVAVYIGQNSVIHAISNGPKTGVTISKLDSGYWKRRVRNFNRVIKQPAKETPKQQNAEIHFERGKYKGNLLNGEPEGKGLMLLNNGDSYSGDFRKGLFNGTGKYTWNNGDVYTGKFVNGYFQGQGEKTYKNGEYLKAAFIKGKAEGQGLYKWNNEKTFSGYFKNDNILKGWISIKGKKYWLEKSSSGFDLYKDSSKSAKLQSSQNIQSLLKNANKTQENYMFKKDSVWEKWDGNIYGDYDLWREKEKSDFEKWKEQNEKMY